MENRHDHKYSRYVAEHFLQASAGTTALIGGENWIRRFEGAQPRPIQSETNRTKESIMKKFAALLAAFVVLAGPLAAASKDEKETDRLENCGIVVKEIMDIPDDIPQDLIDKAECIIVYPSVLKAAFVVGGSYGRGVKVTTSALRRRGSSGTSQSRSAS
jgi:uncharacterized membrane protein YgcG